MSSLSQLWKNYQRYALARGEFVREVLSAFITLKKKRILDIGCGSGGTAVQLHNAGANVTAVDIVPEAPQLFNNCEINFVAGAFEKIKFPDQKFDVIILQDVLEHFQNPKEAISKVKSLLEESGVVFVSTPNRFSIFNLLRDPHWNLPLVALCNRPAVKFLVQKIFRKDLRQRSDWAALLSLPKLRRIFSASSFQIKFVNTRAAKKIFQQPEAIVCDAFHIKLIMWLKKCGMERWLTKFVNDRFKIFNLIVNPTWYFVCRIK